MDIAALSVSLSQMQTSHQASLSVTKMTMDIMEGQGADLAKLLDANVQQLQQLANPHLGQNINTKI